MPSKKNIHTGTRSYLPIDPFAARIGGLHEAAKHGDNPLQLAEAVRKNWMQLDPLTTNKGGEAIDRRPRLVAALGKAVQVVEQVPVRQLKGTKLRNMGRHLLLDQAAADIRLSQAPQPAVERRLEGVVSEIAQRPERQETQFEELSAKAMLLHLQARELHEKPMEPWQRSGSEAILKVSLGGLIKESVASVRALNGAYHASLARGANTTLISGREVEAMRFTFELMRAYRTDGSLANAHPRFSVFREDRPTFQATPRRSFDIVVVPSDPTAEPELVQVKTTKESQYAEGITVWTPNTNVIAEADAVVSWFDTLVDNEASDAVMENAWHNLSARFAEPPRA